MCSEVLYPEFSSVTLSEVIYVLSVPKNWLEIPFEQWASLEEPVSLVCAQANNFILVSKPLLLSWLSGNVCLWITHWPTLL